MENKPLSAPKQPIVEAVPVDSPEFDPFSNAKPCSPFYLYNHDPSPRPSTDHRPKLSTSVSVHDLEAGSSQTLTPSVTQEKIDNNIKLTKTSTWRSQILPNRCQQDKCGPKQKGWLKRMPKKQQIIVKTVIALITIGCMVGIAVGIAVGTQSGVNKSNGQQGQIHS